MLKKDLLIFGKFVKDGYKCRITPATWGTTGSDGKTDMHWGFDQSHGSLDLLSCHGEDCSKKITRLTVTQDLLMTIELFLDGNAVHWATNESNGLVFHGNKWGIEVNGAVGVVDFLDIPVTFSEDGEEITGFEPPWDVIVPVFQSEKPFEVTIRILEPFEEE